MADHRHTVLFLCTGNSARSIMAEAIANQRFGEWLEAVSAGSSPRGEIHPMALDTIARNGLSAAGLRSKSWSAVGDRPLDLVVTLCDQARGEPCPVLPGAPLMAHWSLPDPPAAADPQAMFSAVFEALAEAIGGLAQKSPTDLVERASEAAVGIQRRFPPAGR